MANQGLRRGAAFAAAAVIVGSTVAWLLARYDYYVADECLRRGFFWICQEYGPGPARWRVRPHLELTDLLVGAVAAAATYAALVLIAKVASTRSAS